MTCHIQTLKPGIALTVHLALQNPLVFFVMVGLTHSTEAGFLVIILGNSKLANILFTKELQRRFKARGVPIISVAVHPGGVITGI